jgi:hypothetical protein
MQLDTSLFKFFYVCFHPSACKGIYSKRSICLLFVYYFFDNVIERTHKNYIFPHAVG